MIRSIDIVLGAGFGDEGKGLVTNYLSQQCASPFVIRFNGGHQAYHTVQTETERHVFSNFGSGTLDGAPTYWSNFCTVDPIGVCNEYQALQDHEPTLYIDSLCPVTTPYDICYNRWLESKRTNKHGSVGVGFGATVERNLTPYKLHAVDLTNKFALEHKLEAIKTYYSKLGGDDLTYFYSENQIDKKVEAFKNAIGAFLDIVSIRSEYDMFGALKAQNTDHNLIFEGAQGILLDMDHGVFPYMTRSNTTSKNVMSLLERNKVVCGRNNVYYVSRAYHTRHGEGPFLPHQYKAGHYEDLTNATHDWQGELRLAPLDLDMLKYALEIDSNYIHGCTEKLFMTCMNQIGDEWEVQRGGRLVVVEDKSQIYRILGFSKENVLESYSPLGIPKLKAV